MARTLKLSQKGFFDVLKRALKRVGETFVESRKMKTLILEVGDASLVEPICGSHRIQRIPPGSSSRHTSTATISVVDTSCEEVWLDEADLTERFQRGSGPGGQHKNKTDSKVVLTHDPTGVTVSVDGRSQWRNRQEARQELLRRLKSREEKKEDKKVGGDRSAKTFTHNSQRNEVVDHLTGRRWRMSDWNKGKI